MTWIEIQNYISGHPADASVIIPIGPIEEHGPHLPIDADIKTAVVVAEIVAQEHHCLVFPAIPLMICGISKETTGTYSIETETLKAITKDLVSQMAKKGFRKILFFTGHGGYSIKVIREAIKEVHSETNTSFTADVLNFEQACPSQNGLVGTMDITDIHAGGIETSRMMFLSPNDVKYPLPPADFHNGQELSQSGICGDPQRATKEKGQAIVEKTVSTIISWLKV